MRNAFSKSESGQRYLGFHADSYIGGRQILHRPSQFSHSPPCEMAPTMALVSYYTVRT